MSAPQVIALNRTEVAIPEVEGHVVLGVRWDVGRVTRVPPGVPGEGAYRRAWRWVQHAEQWSGPVT